MAYNTGNPLGSTSPKDLSDNAEGLDHAANDLVDYWTDRFGRQRVTLEGMSRLSNLGAAVEAAERAEAAAVAASLNAGMYPDTATMISGGGGFSPVPDGHYAQMPSPAVNAYIDLYRRSGASMILIDSYPNTTAITEVLARDSRTINIGKDYPFLRKVRGGADVAQRQAFSDAILDVEFYNTDPLYYYRLAVFGNGNVTNGGPSGQGIRIEKALISTYETVGTAVIIHNNTSAVGLGLDYSIGGVQKRRITTDTDNVTVVLTVDMSKLPAYGTSITATAGQVGGNWIFDPATYRQYLYPLQIQQNQPSLDGIDSMTVNGKKLFPQVFAARSAGATLVRNTAMDACLLDFEIIGAKRGYFYRLEYLLNGNTGFGESQKYGVAVTRIPVARLAEGYTELVISRTHLTQQVQPDRVKGGVQEFYLNCPNDPLTNVRIVLDVDAMPPDGTSILQTNPGTAGYNTIISTAKYQYRDELVWAEKDVLLQWDATAQRLTTTYKAGSKWYQVNFQKKGPNNTFDILGFGYADAYTVSPLNEIIPPQLVPAWTMRAEGESDFRAPKIFRAINNGDIVVRGTGATPGDTVTVYIGASPVATNTVYPTGGWAVRVNDFAVIGDILNVQVGSAAQAQYTVTTPLSAYASGTHGIDGGSGGGPTAEQRELQIFLDGVSFSLSRNLTKRGRSIKILGSVAVKSYNTFLSGRYTAMENYVYDINNAGVWVDETVFHMEANAVTADNGCQCYMAGMTPLTASTYLFWGGDQTSRQVVGSDVFNSGPKSAYPRCMGVTVRHSAAGELSSWMDLDYGVGDRAALLPENPVYIRSNVNGAKIYPRLFSLSNEQVFQAGESYKWRGGYYWGMPTNSGDYDAIVRTQAGFMLLKPNGTYSVVGGATASY